MATIERSKFKTVIGTLYYLWIDRNNEINAVYIRNNRSACLQYLKKLRNEYGGSDKLIFNDKKSNKIETAVNDYLKGIIRNIGFKYMFLAGTEFERKVWNKLASVPYGETISYKKLAELIGHSGACRAVGSALRKNPLMLAVPCHRVIRSNGNIGKFSGGEKVKRFLLNLENSCKPEETL